MTAADVDTILAVALAADFACEPCDVAVPWLWGDVNDPTDYTLVGHVDPGGNVTELRLVSEDTGKREDVPAGFVAMARADLREAAIELWGKR